MASGIAATLLAAEQRGREMEREEVRGLLKAAHDGADEELKK